MNIIQNYFFNFLVLSLIILPLFLLLRPLTLRKSIMIGAGLYMLYIIAPRLIIYYLVFWLIVWLGQRSVHYFSSWKVRTPLFWTFVILLLSPMIIWKLYPDMFSREVNISLHHFLWSISPRLGELDALKNPLIPIGLSFNTFRALDLLIQSHIGLLPRLSILDTLFFGFFPPIMVIGPIIQYQELSAAQNQKEDRPLSRSIGLGLEKIVVGLCKLYLLALPLKFSETGLVNFSTLSSFQAWIACFIVAWFFYLNFSGFSDIAIGCSRLYGYNIKENFDYPFFKPNLSLFWSSWNISLTQFAMRYIFTPLGGYRKKSQYIAIIATIITIALWHNISFGMLIFGIWHAIGLCVQRYFTINFRNNISKSYGGVGHWFCVAGTFMYVMVSFPLMIMPLPKALKIYKLLLFWTS